MVSFLFWNLNKKNIETIVASIALQNDIDVIMLVETPSRRAAMLEKLNEGREASYKYMTGRVESKVEMYAQCPEDFLIPKFDDGNGRYTIRHLKLPSMTDILLAVVHVPSKMHSSPFRQFRYCQILEENIEMCERDVGHSRTILFGDLNMNPFEAGVIGASALHAVMTKSLAKSGNRRIQGRTYQYFYNPMWGFFGDCTRCPPGTYYYRRGDEDMLFWNIFDQVLIRPDLLDRFKYEDLEILDSDGENSLLSENGLPNVSDHLPIIFKLDLS